MSDALRDQVVPGLPWQLRLWGGGEGTAGERREAAIRLAGWNPTPTNEYLCHFGRVTLISKPRFPHLQTGSNNL